MQRYLCILRVPADAAPHSLETERAAVLDELRRGGRLVAALAPEPSGVVVRVRAGHVSVAVAAPADDPAIDAIFVLEARDLNEAIQLAARDPGARHGLVEVRPLRSFG